MFLDFACELALFHISVSVGLFISKFYARTMILRQFGMGELKFVSSKLGSFHNLKCISWEH